MRAATYAVFVGCALICAFCLGGAFQAYTATEANYRSGAIAALYDIRSTAISRYVNCLSDHCERQLATYQDVIAITDERLIKLRAASAIPSRRADDAEGGSAGTEGSAVPKADAQTPKSVTKGA